jgi:ABC-2 type transport system permease protein
MRARFNPNLDSGWFSSVMQVLNNVTLLTIILTGAALIRERERYGRASPGDAGHAGRDHARQDGGERAGHPRRGGGLAVLVVEWTLGVPIAGSLLLFVLGTAIYAFRRGARHPARHAGDDDGAVRPARDPGLRGDAASLGRDDADGGCRSGCNGSCRVFSPTPHFVAFSQGVLYRGAGLDVVWPEIAKIIAIGAPISPSRSPASGK